MSSNQPNAPLDPGLLDTLWDIDDPAGSEARLRAELERHATDSLAAQELTTQVARALGLQGRLDEAEALLSDIDASHSLIRARVALERGRLRNEAGDTTNAMHQFASAMGHATMGRHAYLAVDAAHMLAIVDPPNAESWTRQGLGIAAASEDPRARRWRGPLDTNLGWTLAERGDHEAALAQFEQALAAFRETGTDRQVHVARWTVGHTLRELGRLEEALAIQRELARDDAPDPRVAEEIAALTEVMGEREPAWRAASFEEALAQARASLAQGGVPVGSALDIGGRLVASGHNRRVQDGDPIAHGEMSCLRAAGRQRSYRDAVLYTTLAPCAMCSGAIIQFGIPIVVVGESETFPGELDLLRERGVTVIELDDARCKALMREFQERYPQVWAEDIGEA